jgi:hypothetical protein
MERLLLKPTILSKSHDYHQILSSPGASGYRFMETVIDMMEQLSVGKAAMRRRFHETVKTRIA